jgi:hypothetical protein
MIVLTIFALGWLIAALDKHYLPKEIDPHLAHA